MAGGLELHGLGGGVDGDLVGVVVHLQAAVRLDLLQLDHALRLHLVVVRVRVLAIEIEYRKCTSIAC